jgi:hypothetical protein
MTESQRSSKRRNGVYRARDAGRPRADITEAYGDSVLITIDGISEAHHGSRRYHSG